MAGSGEAGTIDGATCSGFASSEGASSGEGGDEGSAASSGSCAGEGSIDESSSTAFCKRMLHHQLLAMVREESNRDPPRRPLLCRPRFVALRSLPQSKVHRRLVLTCVSYVE